MKVCGLPFTVLKPLMIQLDMIPQYVPFFSYLFIFGAEEKVEERDLREDVLSGERPWLAQISVMKDSGKPVECSGSLLNK